MTALSGLMLVFLILTLVLVIGLVVFLRRRFAGGRKAGQFHADDRRMPSPAAREE
jgi:predicted lipid-binding transport protein (Tim44 family)